MRQPGWRFWGRSPIADEWTPFRPGPQDHERIAGEVAAIAKIQDELLANHPDLKVADRGAHQYQVAGSRVDLRIDPALPAELDGIGLFEPGSVHHGIARLSNGLGYPHLEIPQCSAPGTRRGSSHTFSKFLPESHVAGNYEIEWWAGN
jgi:hypothetical protein